QLETGRRNQIRVHFAESGHPILGDMRYRPDLWQHLGWPFKRLALHAATLGFRHPITDEALRFESSMPREMSEFLRFIDNAGDSPGRGSAARSSADRRGQPSAERQERDRRGHTKGRRDQTKRRRRK
ncbi:MAG: hypothetical protein KDA91_19635, partial [Planctomycetaceae bacterium]|nr:hypothetical protein [Planctomycetaceae bacterium]